MSHRADPIPNPSTGKLPRTLRWTIAVVAGLLLIGVSLPAVKTEYWVGHRERMLVVAVADSESKVPVPRAVITVFPGSSEVGVGMPLPAPDPSDSRTQRFSTGNDGKAKESCQFDAYGHKNRFTDWGRIRFFDRYIRVTAGGYDATQFRLGERIGEVRDFHDDSPIELLVELKPARSTGAAGVE